MAELAPDQPWPIAPWGPAYAQWAENDAWWTGNVANLQDLYRGNVPRATHRVRGDDYEGGLVGWVASKFWGRPVPAGEHRTRVHIPAAADVATLSSDLLFAEPPSIEYPEDAADVDEATKARLAEIATSDQALVTYAEGGELTAAFGASALTAVWDEDVTDRVRLVPSGADVTIPEFRAGVLSALNLWSEYVDGSIYFRHIERHEKGRILHTLYQGTKDRLGRIVPLQDRPETAPLAELPGLTEHGIETGIDRLTAAWWINAPARAWRRSGILAEAGRSDYSGGMLGLFDALDEAWSSWMRDLALGRARLIVDAAALDQGPATGDGGTMDLDREVFQGLNLPGLPDKPLIESVQFEIRVDEHERTTQALFRRILATGGYGELDKETGGVQQTATEINVRSSSRERTRDRKALYAKQTLAEIVRTAMLLDGVKFPGNGGGDHGPVEINFPPASQQDPEKVARTIASLRSAQAASIETGVRLANPNARKQEIDEEVDRIKAERQIADPTRVGSPVTDPEAARAEAERLGFQAGNGQQGDGEQGGPARG